MELSRDEWMVINLALQDRIAVLLEKGSGTPLVGKAIAECERLEKLTRAHVDATWVPPK
jgi:hypothetical protein